MIEQFLQDRAALYVSGAMAPEQREEFELILEFQPELRALVNELQEVGATLALAQAQKDLPAPSSELKSRILREIAAQGAPPAQTALVVTGPNRLVRWINQEFATMCGYSLAELAGKNLGPILQGERTDRPTVRRMRAALKEEQPCRETLLNYRKDGSPYVVEIVITPIRDDRDRLRWFIARERLVEFESA